MDEPKERALWDTESGLVDDVDGWIVNPRFGIKEEYSQAVIETTGGESKGAMLLFDLQNEAGEIIGSQGYSIGTGWEISEDGRYITHAKRKNVVTNTRYGQLQIRVVKELGIDMEQYGAPTDALSWDGLGFHWNQEAHDTVGGVSKTSIMPTSYLSRIGEEAAAAPEPAAQPVTKPAAKPVARPVAKPVVKGVSAGEQAAIKLVSETGTVKEFILKAVKVPEIAQDEALMNRCLDDSPTGFFKAHKGK